MSKQFYELRDVTNDESYYVIAAFKTEEAAQKVIAEATSPEGYSESPYDTEERVEWLLVERQFGLNHYEKKIATVKWTELFDNDSDTSWEKEVIKL